MPSLPRSFRGAKFDDIFMNRWEWHTAAIQKKHDLCRLIDSLIDQDFDWIELNYYLFYLSCNVLITEVYGLVEIANT